MYIALVSPPFDIVKSYGGGKRTQRGALPPLGVGYLASMIEARGHRVTFLDAPLLELDTAATTERILADAPDVVGISCVTKLASSAYALAHAVKVRAGHIPIVLGGAHATSFSDEILQQCPHIDFLVPGEGELSFAELLECLAAGTPVENVPGILYRSADGRIAATPPREPVRDLDTLPHPSRRIYRNDLYVPLPNQCRRKPATTVITSRGCPYGRCKFCYQGGRYASTYRRRSPENVVDEIGQLTRDLGFREIIFWDDNFCINPKWIASFCDLVGREKLDITWTVQSRVDTVTPEMLERIAAAGCYNIYFGFESGNQQMLDLVNKGITTDQSRNAVKWAKRAGLEIRGSFIFGMPGETPEMAEQTIRFACELDVDWMIFYPYHVHRGTALAEIAAREGTVLEEGVDLHLPSYVPNTYGDIDELAAMVRSAYRRFYLRPQYMARALWRARNPVVLRNYLDAFWYWMSYAHGK